MSILASDIVVYGAANQAEDDSSVQGGAIDITTRYVFDDSVLANTLNDTVSVVSSNAGDTTQTVTVTGRLSTGVIDSEILNLNGTTQVDGAIEFERILKIEIDASHAGTVTAKKTTGLTTIVAIETGVLTIRRPFYNVASDAAGGSSRSYYEKVFVKNNHSTLAYLSAVIQESADPTGKVTFDLEDAVNDNNSIASRLNTAPTGMLGTFTNSDKAVPGTDLGPGDAIGVWLKLTLGAGDAATKSTWTMDAEGSTV